MVHVAKRLVTLLFPPTCVLCGDGAGGKTGRDQVEVLDLCAGCALTLPDIDVACLRCAEPLSIGADSIESGLVCGACQKKPPRYDASTCAMRYEYPVDHLLRAFKFHGRLVYGRTLAELLAQRLRAARCNPWPELLIPVPLATARFRERGFNQAIEIGTVLEDKLKIPLRADIVRRTRHTREQSGLEARERRKNLRGAFAVERKSLAKHVAIVDDVITTGSTMNELARTLRRAGAERIEAWALARTSKIPGR